MSGPQTCLEADKPASSTATELPTPEAPEAHESSSEDRAQLSAPLTSVKEEAAQPTGDGETEGGQHGDITGVRPPAEPSSPSPSRQFEQPAEPQMVESIPRLPLAPRLPVSAVCSVPAEGDPLGAIYLPNGSPRAQNGEYRASASASASPKGFASSDDGRPASEDEDGAGGPVDMDEDETAGDMGLYPRHSGHEGQEPVEDGLQPVGALMDAGGESTPTDNYAAVESAKLNLQNCQQKLLEKVRMWGYPTRAEDYVRRWTITRNRSGNYHYQTPQGRRFTSRDAVRDLLADMHKAGKFEEAAAGALGLLTPGRAEVWTNGIKACLSWRADAPGGEDLPQANGLGSASYLAPRATYSRKAPPSTKIKWQLGGEAEANLWSTQKKLMESVLHAGFSQDIADYVQTWRVVTIGIHEYNYHLPRGLGKVRSMKAAVQRLRELQEQGKLQTEVAAIKPGRTRCNLDKNGRPTLSWERADGRPGSPEPSNSGGAPTPPPLATVGSHVVHRPTPVSAHPLWLSTPDLASSAALAVSSLLTVPTHPLGRSPLLPSGSPAAPPALINGLSNGLSHHDGMQSSFQSLKRPFPGQGVLGEYSQGNQSAKRPATMSTENGHAVRSPNGLMGYPLTAANQQGHNSLLSSDPAVAELLCKLEERIRAREQVTAYRWKEDIDRENAKLREQLSRALDQLRSQARDKEESDKRIKTLTGEGQALRKVLEAFDAARDVAAAPGQGPAAGAMPMESVPSAKGEAEQAGSPKDADMRTAELEARAHMLTGKLKETVVELKGQRDLVATLQKENFELRDKILELELK